MKKIFLLNLVLWTVGVQAQPHPDTSFLDAAIENNILLYTQSIKGHTALYNGSQYKQPGEADEEHPFFESYDWRYGTVTYDGQFYNNVPLLYDITSDQLITENYYNASETVLVDEKLNRFTIGDHTFIKLNDETLPEKGFYQLLYNGPSTVVALRQKNRQETIASQTIEITFNPRNRYYIYKDGVYFQVKRKGSVLKVFQDKKRELKTFIKKNKLSFRPDPTTALSQVAARYDALTKLP